MFNSEAQISRSYDKQHLVPFGEYLPFQNFLEMIGLEQLTRIKGGFTAGSGPSLISLADIPSFRPLICYEAIFSGAINDGSHRPSWILNVTNDGWFGDTAGPHQHLHQARIRAVEEGLPLVRAANTGISAIIDPYGRILFQLELNKEGVIDGDLPVAAPPTIYSKIGVSIMFLFLLLGLLIPVFFVIRKEDILQNRSDP